MSEREKMDNQFMRLPWVLLTALTVVSAFLRLYGLGDRCLWLDEAMAWRANQFDWLDMVRRVSNPLEADNPPLYFAFLHQWTKLFGDDEFILRLPSALAGTVTVPAMFFFLRNLTVPPFAVEKANAIGGIWLGLVAAALVATSELQIVNSRQVRMYSFGGLLFIVSSWALLRSLRPGSSHAWWAMYGVLATTFLYTHNLALFTVISQLFFALVYLTAGFFKPKNSAIRVNSARQVKGLIAVILGITLFYIPEGMILAERSMETTRANSWMGPLEWKQVSQAIAEATFSEQLARDYKDSSFGPFLVVAIALSVPFVCLSCGWAGRFLALSVLVPIGGMIVYSSEAGTSLFLPRYLTFVQMAWLAGAAVALSRLTRPLAIITLVLGAVSWAACTIPSAQSILTNEARPGMRAAVQFMTARRSPDEMIVSQMTWTHVKLAYYAHGQANIRLIAVIPTRHLQPMSAYLIDEELASPEIVAHAEVSGFWLVSSSSYNESAGVHFPLPGKWRRVESVWFVQDLQWERPILVEHFVKEPTVELNFRHSTK